MAIYEDDEVRWEPKARGWTPETWRRHGVITMRFYRANWSMETSRFLAYVEITEASHEEAHVAATE